MSNRTAAANRAVEAAWQNEQGHIYEGKGTRDWTPQQQKDIMERGKAYDENGKAFEGHHMKSVEAHPDYQGEPENIQFLSRDEHKAAHNGNFQNPTNGYYDHNTGETKKFNETGYEPCKAENLSDQYYDFAQQNDNTQESQAEEEMEQGM